VGLDRAYCNEPWCHDQTCAESDGENEATVDQRPYAVYSRIKTKPQTEETRDSTVNLQELVLWDIGVVIKAAALLVTARDRVSAHALCSREGRRGFKARSVNVRHVGVVVWRRP